MGRNSTGFLAFVFLGLLAAAIDAAVFGAEKIQQQEPAAPATPGREARVRGAAILAAGVEAAGGATLSKVESMQLTTRRQTYIVRGIVETDVSSFPEAGGPVRVPGRRQGPVESELELWVVYPAQMRSEESIVSSFVTGGYAPSGSGPITPMQAAETKVFASAEGYDGTAGWWKTPKGTVALPLDEAARLRIDLVGALGLYRRATEGKIEADFADEEEVQGRKVLGVEWRGPLGTKRYFDPQTHLLVGMKCHEVTAEGAFDFLELWSDYRRASLKSGGKEEAIQFPFTSVTYRDGKKYFEEKVKKLKLNARVNAKIFAKP